MKVLIVLAALALAGCLNDEGGGALQVHSIPSLNIWIASLDSNRSARVLVHNAKYYDPSLSGEVKRYKGSAYWSIPHIEGVFQAFRDSDRPLVRLRETCVIFDTIVFNQGAVNSFGRKREIKWWGTAGKDTILYTSYPAFCAAQDSRDSLVARGFIDSTLYIVDTSFAVDSKRVRYIQSIEFYYAQKAGRESKQIAPTYSFDAPGFFLGSDQPFLGSYKIYH